MEASRTIPHRGEAVSIPVVGYLPGCFPDEETFRRAAQVLAGAGIIRVEIGVPGSVPPLEGATLTGALASVEIRYPNVESVLATATRIAAEEGLQPIPMAFRGTVFETLGLDLFLTVAAENGAWGVLVPDATEAEKSAIERSARAVGIGVVRFLAADRKSPFVSDERPLFSYLQTSAMPTGGSFSPDPELSRRIDRARRSHTIGGSSPVALGFGIRTPDHVRQALSFGADLVVVGTAMVDALSAGIEEFTAYVRSLADAGRETAGGSWHET